MTMAMIVTAQMAAKPNRDLAVVAIVSQHLYLQ